MSIATGAVFQICWVVDDLDAAEQQLTEQFGVAKFMRLNDVRFTPETSTLRGAPADYSINLSLGYAGEQQLELIQPVSGTSLYFEHLEKHGPGLHHVAWMPADYDAALRSAVTSGADVEQEGTMADAGMRFAYLAGGPLGSHIELMQIGPQIAAMFDRLRAAAN